MIQMEDQLYELEIDYGQPRESGTCSCCGSTTTTLNRLVTRGKSPFAICHLTFSPAHSDIPARAVIGMGEFGPGTTPGQRVAFGVALSPEGVMLIDANREEWAGMDLLGLKLAREQALQHPLKPELFRLIDQLYAEDEPLREFLFQ